MQNYPRLSVKGLHSPNRNVIPFKINIYLFAATSSPSCANSALRSTTREGKFSHGKISADCIRNNFCDNCLKSSEAIEDAIYILKTIHDFFTGRRFNFTNIISNVSKATDFIFAADKSRFSGINENVFGIA